MEKSKTEMERQDETQPFSISFFLPHTGCLWLFSCIHCAKVCVPPEPNVSSHSIPWPDNHSNCRQPKEKTNTFCICKLLTPLQMTIPSHLHKCCSQCGSLWDYSIVKTQLCFWIWEALCTKATKNNSVWIKFSGKYKGQIVILYLKSPINLLMSTSLTVLQRWWIIYNSKVSQKIVCYIEFAIVPIWYYIIVKNKMFGLISNDSCGYWIKSHSH